MQSRPAAGLREARRVARPLSRLGGRATPRPEVRAGARHPRPRALPARLPRHLRGAAATPAGALAAVEKLADPAIVVLKDFHPYLQDPAVVRALRELAHALKSTYTTLVLLSPVLVIPPEIEKEVSVLDIPLPTYHDLLDLLKEIVGVVRRSGRATVELTNEDADQLIKAAQGLTLSEAESAFAKAIATDGRLSRDDVPLVLEEKRQVIRKSGLLEYFATDESLANVGGMASLKRWLDRRGTAFSEAARKFGLPEPKGLLLLGVQGCGKSLTAKAIAAQWRLPLLRLSRWRASSRGPTAGGARRSARRSPSPPCSSRRAGEAGDPHPPRRRQARLGGSVSVVALPVRASLPQPTAKPANALHSDLASATHSSCR